MNIVRKITLIEQKIPLSTDTNELLKWFSNSVGLVSPRDTEKSCFRIFIELIKDIESNGLKSDDLAAATNLTRGTAVYHLHTLIESGIVTSKKNTYSLREDSLKNIVLDLRNDIDKFFNKLEKVAEQLDQKLTPGISKKQDEC